MIMVEAYQANQEELWDIITYIQENQVDKIDAGFAYNQTDIIRKLNRFI